MTYFSSNIYSNEYVNINVTYMKTTELLNEEFLWSFVSKFKDSLVTVLPMYPWEGSFYDVVKDHFDNDLYSFSLIIVNDVETNQVYNHSTFKTFKISCFVGSIDCSSRLRSDKAAGL